MQVYATDLKAALAGVPADLLAEHGPVSVPTAEAMARGVRERLGATYGLALTGVAGPGGAGGPPGRHGRTSRSPTSAARSAAQVRLPGDRARVRLLAVTAGLDLLRRRLL